MGKAKIKVLLYIPTKGRQANVYPPIGLAYINAALRMAGFHVLCLSGFDNEALIERTMTVFRPHFALSGGTSYDWKELKGFFQKAKSLIPDVVTVGGGVGYTSSPIAFSELTGVDYALLGEGDSTAVNLINCIWEEIPPSEWDIPGIVVRRKRRWVLLDERNHYESVEALPFPSYEGFPLEIYFDNQRNAALFRNYDQFKSSPRVLTIAASRSCPYACGFCCHSIGRLHRERDLESVLEEIRSYVKYYGVNGVFFTDELFSTSRQRIVDFCSMIKATGVKWAVELRVDFIDEELLGTMKDAGCITVLLGLESVSEDTLDEIGKKITVGQIERAVKSARNSGMRLEGYLLFGTPLENEKSFQRNFDFWKKYRDVGVRFSQLVLYPGTRYYEVAVKANLIHNGKTYIKDGLPYLNITSIRQQRFETLARVARLTLGDSSHYGSMSYRTDDDASGVFDCVCPSCGERFSVVLGYDINLRGDAQFDFFCPMCKKPSFYKIEYDNRGLVQLMREQVSSLTQGCCIDAFVSTNLRNRLNRDAALFGSESEVAILRDLFTRIGYSITCFGFIEVSEDRSLEDTVRYLNENNIEMLILAVGYSFEQVACELRDLGFSGEIISALNIVFDFPYHQGFPCSRQEGSN